MALNPDDDTELRVQKILNITEVLTKAACSNDALRKHGIIPPRVRTPPSPSPPPSPRLEDVLSNATPSELKEMEDDELDSDTERIIASYRSQRLAELRISENRSRFGEIYPISREDYTAEVTNASQIDSPDEPEIKGTGIVCFLYKDGQAESTRLAIQLKTLAIRHPRTKFVSIVGDKCISNYSDELCPTLIIYRGGNVTRQVVAWGRDKERTLAELEAMLILSLAITTPSRSSEAKEESDGDMSDDEGRSSVSRPSINPGVNQPRPHQKFRSNVHEDDDSDFDL